MSLADLLNDGSFCVRETCRCSQRDPEKHWNPKEHAQFHELLEKGHSREDANFIIASARVAKGGGR